MREKKRILISPGINSSKILNLGYFMFETSSCTTMTTKKIYESGYEISYHHKINYFSKTMNIDTETLNLKIK